jgi:hypothetical protein
MDSDPDPDTDPAIFVTDLQRREQKTNLKNSQNNRNQGFSYYFWLMTEGSGSRSVPTNRSGSKRPNTYGSGYATLFLINYLCANLGIDLLDLLLNTV